jgi:hypothetical protein
MEKALRGQGLLLPKGLAAELLGYRRSQTSLSSDHSAISTQVSAPHRMAHSAIKIISRRSYRCAGPLRGFTTFAYAIALFDHPTCLEIDL